MELEFMATVKGPEPLIAVRSLDRTMHAGQRFQYDADFVETEYAIPTRPVAYANAKRALDIVLSLLGIVLFAPIFLLVALLVKITSRGPVIFRQTRVGVGGRLFTCYKFRSMYQDAEHRKAELMHLNETTGPVFKMKNDPRITPVGRILRKLSLDELPQLFNVLRGDMSIVGPRPPVPQEVIRYSEHELRRLSVVPGLTCLWQISGRSTIGFERWVELDLAYIDNMSFWNDLKIIAMTVPAVVSGRGAH
jgi:exopolysaccharide biosynthesis polyprenyl glycosylphosphotransferase